MNKLFWIFLTVISGAILPIQAGLNARLGKAAANPVYAAIISFLVGTIGLILYIVITRQTMSWTSLKTAPLYLWTGGLLGAFYVTMIILAFPKLGPGLTIGLIIAGQMAVSVLMDHFNVLVAQPSPINFMRVLGVLLIVGGVIIIGKY